MFIASSLLYLANVLFFRKGGGLFFVSYYNDVCCGIWFVAYSNLLLRHIGKRLDKLYVVIPYLFVWSLMWEYIGPYIKATSITDSHDILAYLLGGSIYCIASKIPFPKRNT